MALINSMSLRGKLMLGASALAFIIAVVLILKMATTTGTVTVMTGVDPAKSAEITAALSSAGVEGELVNAGTELKVPKGQEDKAVTALATAGVTAGKVQAGFADTIDKQKLGASNMQQKIAYQRGLEGEIANAISKIDGVGQANVRLTLPDDTTFVGSENKSQATAAVVLGSDSALLAPGAVRGIAGIVSNSVPKLNPQNVTITDASGSLLWPGGDGAAGTGGTSKAAAEAARAQAAEAKLNAMLDQTLGAGKARVQVNYDLNMDKTSQEQLKYAKKGTPTRDETANESLDGTGSVPNGAAGVQANVPTYGAGTGTANGRNRYRHKTKNTDYGVGKTITKTDKATGAVNRMQLSLIVDKNLGLNGIAVQQLQKTVENAAGYVPGRDSSSAVQLTFPKAPVEKTGPVPTGIASLLKAVGIGLAALLFLFFLSRHLRRRETDELMDEPSWLRQLPRPPEPEIVIPEAELGAGGQAGPHIMASLATKDPRRIALEDIVDREPDKVAAHLRSWITEDGQ